MFVNWFLKISYSHLDLGVAIFLRFGHNGTKTFQKLQLHLPPPSYNRFFATILPSSWTPPIVGQNLNDSDLNQSWRFSDHCGELPDSDDVFIISAVERLPLRGVSSIDALFSEHASNHRQIWTLKKRHFHMLAKVFENFPSRCGWHAVVKKLLLFIFRRHMKKLVYENNHYRPTRDSWKFKLSMEAR